jgi:hypothetical protein
MDHVQWPTPAEVQSWLTIAGAWNGVTDDLSDTIQGVIDATVRTLEDATGWSPFLAEPDTSTRNYDAPGPYNNGYMGRTGGGNKLFLEGGYISITSIKIDGVLQDTADYKLLSPGSAWPYTQVRFLTGRVYSEPLGIEITGKQGFCTVIPANVWEAVRDKAGASMLGPLATLRRVTAESNQATVIKSKETGPVKTEYAVPSDASKTTDFSALKRMWDSGFDFVAGQYMLV